MSRRPVLVPVVALLSVSGLGVTAGTGGLDTEPDSPPKQYQAGATIDQKLFKTQFVKAVDVAEGDRHAVELVLKVTNEGDTTESVGAMATGPKVSRHGRLGSTILKTTPPLGKPDSYPEIGVWSHGVRSFQLHPGITHTVVIRYDLPEGATPPEKVTVDVGGFVEEPVSRRDPRELWQVEPDKDLPTGAGDEMALIEPKVIAQVTLPIRPEEA
ncbi:hypothetical protein GT755_27400 [Herbidospora sp. NEAU-GS84]|uniref:Uncharacterized protein n=1 Tax=Herbidospora solisilvae TaxID=2696284 RepID=A0A7C9P1X4_9ACTN|nr:hypothetical protein [Herbidospora solisilvae]NAS25397.1 hypothetical protein [Herbidospora solisilvae]